MTSTKARVECVNSLCTFPTKGGKIFHSLFYLLGDFHLDDALKCVRQIRTFSQVFLDLWFWCWSCGRGLHFYHPRSVPECHHKQKSKTEGNPFIVGTFLFHRVFAVIFHRLPFFADGSLCCAQSEKNITPSSNRRPTRIRCGSAWSLASKATFVISN